MSKIQKTEAMKIFEARRASYAPGVSGFMDETELLLMSQHFSELAAREKPHRYRPNPARAKAYEKSKR